MIYFRIDGTDYVDAVDYNKLLGELEIAEDKIAKLESELSEKENMLKTYSDYEELKERKSKMNRSDFEKMQKIEEEYEKYLKESPVHKVIDEIMKDIEERENNAMDTEFMRKIAELLIENGISIRLRGKEFMEDVEGVSVYRFSGYEIEGLDCADHDRKFTEKIEMIEENNRILSQELEIKNQKLKSANNESAYLKKKISKLESELAVKENLLKTNNEMCRENYLSGLTPIEVAEKLINAEAERETNSFERAFGAGEKERYNIFSVSELRQIAEHLLVYCNHNSEE